MAERPCPKCNSTSTHEIVISDTFEGPTRTALECRDCENIDEPHHVIFAERGTRCAEFPSYEAAAEFAKGKRYCGREAVARPGKMPANFGRRSAGESRGAA